MAKTLRAARISLAVLIAAVAFQSCVSNEIDIRMPDFTTLPDGTYRGAFDGGLVKATVDVLIEGGRMERVTIVSHRCGKGRPAEAIVEEVVRKQSLDVDTVSGATRSSKVILKAVEVALTR